MVSPVRYPFRKLAAAALACLVGTGANGAEDAPPQPPRAFPALRALGRTRRDSHVHGVGKELTHAIGETRP